MEVEATMFTAMGHNATELSPAALALQDTGPYTMTDIIFGLRCYFYLFTPSEMTFKTLEEVPNLFLRGMRYIPLVMIVEIIGLYIRKKDMPRWNHALMSLCTAILVFLPGTIIGNVEFTWYGMLWERFRIVDIPYDSKMAWIICIICCDLGSYLWHRAAHEINFVWAYHSVHHTSDEINISSGYRLPTFNRQMAIMFYLPMAFVFPPAMFYTHYQLNYMFQLWVHTNIFEGSDLLGYFIITPRLHRVHHARNRYCIDKNYGGVFSFWDRLFGTYAPYREEIPLSYGLVTKLKGFDVLAVQFKYFAEMFRRASTYDNFTDKLYTFIKGPGWEPGKPRLGNYSEIPKKYEGDDDVSYDPKNPKWVLLYLTWSVCLTLLLYSTVGTTKQILGTGTSVIQVLYILWTVANVGYILDQKPWAPMSEVLRCTAYFFVASLLGPCLMLYPTIATALRYTNIMSLFIWSFNLNMFCSKNSQKID